MIRILVLLALLSAPNFRTREAAMHALCRLAAALPVPILADAETRLPSAEARRRCGWILDRWYAAHADRLSRQLDCPGIGCLPGVAWSDYGWLAAQLAAAAVSLSEPCRAPCWNQDARGGWRLAVPLAIQVEATRLLIADLLGARQRTQAECLLRSMRTERARQAWQDWF